MQDVFGISCELQQVPPPAGGGNASSHRFCYVAPTLAATVFAALILHLLAELASHLDPADPVGILSVLTGMAAVLMMLMPFTVLFALRARRAWLATLPSPLTTKRGRPSGSAVASGPP
ncbi:MAG TPA: hypothetical protein VD978_32640 [Azospirillum sp.]|nr:hypothetical protein [Azospirillum sp.]